MLAPPARAEGDDVGVSGGHESDRQRSGAERVSGFGGFFFRSADPEAMSAWYATRLGVDAPPATYEEDSWHQEAGATVFAPLAADTDHLGAVEQTWMLNFRVGDLAAMVAQLREAGDVVTVDPEFYPNGRFARLVDPEGNPIQLWEPFGRDAGAPPPPEIDLCFRHVDRFNEGVSSGNWWPMLEQFAPDAEVGFEGRPGGPVVGREAIAAAFTVSPPHDQVSVLSVPTVAGGEAAILFGWRADRGARTGTMRLLTDRPNADSRDAAGPGADRPGVDRSGAETWEAPVIRRFTVSLDR
jgi:predicted enzyme related to lactoylglutathione lyase